MEFVSPTKGKLSFDGVFRELVRYVTEDPDRRYELIVGTDSMLADETTFVTAIVIHRVGRGGRYFYRRVKNRKIESLRQRMFYETALSLEVATKLTGELSQNGYATLPVSIHLDVGTNGETREVIREVVGMVTGNGYEAVIKPDAYGATKVADRHSK
jgi:predicted RNase H-related nuclease YkuK (DUF458 family)